MATRNDNLDSSVDRRVYHRYLQRLPVITDTIVESFIKSNVSVDVTSERAYKFFLEGYNHDFEVYEGECSLWGLRSKCYRSQKKNEPPHSIQIEFADTAILKCICSCPAGRKFCHHAIGTLYQLTHYKKLKLVAVPPYESKTSLPQTWHIPSRRHGLAPQSIPEVTIQKPKKASNGRLKRSTCGISSTMYNAVRDPIENVRVDVQLGEDFLLMNPVPQFAQIWSSEAPTDLVDTTFGKVPVGSLLSYQLPKPPTNEVDGIVKFCNAPHPPPFSLPHLEQTIECPLSYKCSCLIGEIQCTLNQSVQYEQETRQQSDDPKWHLLRKFRLTTSKFKRICSHRAQFEKLADSLLSGKLIQTKAMLHGIATEPKEAKYYSELFARNVYYVGFVINPSAPHLGSSPDRRVYDPNEDEQFGLLEIKCPSSVASVCDCKYLQQQRDGTLKLNRNHEYYYQMLGQLGLTGESRCDFFVYCFNDYHCERIYFDRDDFNAMKCKLDYFYFNHFLLALAAKD